MNFKTEKDFLSKHEKSDDVSNTKQMVTSPHLNKLKEEYSNIPEDYLFYLSEIGAGSIRECQFKVQSYLFDFKDIDLDDIYNIKKGIKFFGDNFSGDFAGFDLSQNNDEVIEFWHDSEQFYYTKMTFREYIREKMLMDINGNDLKQ